SDYRSDVYVNLQTGAATGIGGNVVSFRDVIGGRANNILVGTGGNTLVGGGGRNLLIAGRGSSQLFGGSDDDILIGGFTDYDTDRAALTAIMKEWTRTDVAYKFRYKHITDGGGANDPYLLNNATVHSNGGGNVLMGGPGLDLFFGSLSGDG